MAKTKTRYVCQECGYESARWLGQCGGCSAWNTMVEEAAPQAVKAAVLQTGASGGGRLAGAYGTTRPQRLSDVSVSDQPRLVTGLKEFDQALTELQEAVSLDPTNDGAYLSVAALSAAVADRAARSDVSGAGRADVVAVEVERGQLPGQR